MKKIKQWIKHHKKMVMACCMSALLAVSMAVGASAEGEATSTVVKASDFTSSILTALQQQISVTTIVTVLVAVIGGAIGLVFMWWGVRKLIGVLMRAFKKGKLSL